eukprot:TRINITY_DN8545_c0_g1_i5.p2 TRINITY_DN8545_c0_g1~~TRINITY_DN8545_c0_g1_i5.p2  ORF type:complete len:211 (+),score=24.80 TRINITY_DN8545_c0_g1_i5:295-927(+)
MTGMRFIIKLSSKECTTATPKKRTAASSFNFNGPTHLLAKTSYQWKGNGEMSTKKGSDAREFAKTVRLLEENRLEHRSGSKNKHASDKKAVNEDKPFIENQSVGDEEEAKGMLGRLTTYMEKCTALEQSLNQCNAVNQFMTETQAQEFSLQCYILRRQIEMFHDNYTQIFKSSSESLEESERKVLVILIARIYQSLKSPRTTNTATRTTL